VCVGWTRSPWTSLCDGDTPSHCTPTVTTEWAHAESDAWCRFEYRNDLRQRHGGFQSAGRGTPSPEATERRVLRLDPRNAWLAQAGRFIRARSGPCVAM
jgi:hypothetical protein